MKEILYLLWQSFGIADHVKFLRQVVIGETLGSRVYPDLQE